MTNNPNVKLTIMFNDPEIEPEELDVHSMRLMAELREMDEVETVKRVVDPQPPKGNKASGGFLPGMLATEIKPANLNSLFGVISDRYAQKSVEMEIEVGDRKVTVKATSQAELMATLPMVLKFIDDPASVCTILIFAANPKNTSQLRLDQEVRDITEALKLSIHRDNFALDTRWAVRSRDVQRAMLEKNPRIVHFCGHGEGPSTKQRK
jgi:hypothetical protein